MYIQWAILIWKDFAVIYSKCQLYLSFYLCLLFKRAFTSNDYLVGRPVLDFDDKFALIKHIILRLEYEI